jgi:hypothetical protein
MTSGGPAHVCPVLIHSIGVTLVGSFISFLTVSYDCFVLPYSFILLTIDKIASIF